MWNFLMDGICNQIVLKPETLSDGQPKKFFQMQNAKICLSKYQIEIIVNVLDALEEYFHQNGEGLKKPFFQKDVGMKQLKYTLDRFSESTPSLIRRFMESNLKPQKDGGKEIKPAIVVNYEIAIVRTGRKNYTLKLKAISTENLPIEVMNLASIALFVNFFHESDNYQFPTVYKERSSFKLWTSSDGIKLKFSSKVNLNRLTADR